MDLSLWFKEGNKQLILLSAALYALFVVFLPSVGHAWDNACWGMWSTRMTSHGIHSAYTEGSTVNYLPLYLYVLKAFGEWMGTDHIYAHTYYLKAVTLLFDFGSAYLICSRLHSIKRKWKYLLFIFLNIGFVYNTYFWNQVDGILSFFVLWSFIMAMENKLALSMLAYLLALNFKLQGVVFFPVIGMLWIRSFGLKQMLYGLLYCVLAELLVLSPFIKAGVVANIGDVISGSVDYYKSISMNAYNIWYLLLDGDLFYRKDDVVYAMGLSYRNWGLILFLLSSALVCIPLLVSIIKTKWEQSADQVDMEKAALAMALVVMCFFFFNTQMHERYIHPVLVFSTLLAFKYKQWAQWLIISAAYALSLEKVCKLLELNNYGTLIFHEKFLAGLYLIGFVLLAYRYVKVTLNPGLKEPSV